MNSKSRIVARVGGPSGPEALFLRLNVFRDNGSEEIDIWIYQKLEKKFLFFYQKEATMHVSCSLLRLRLIILLIYSRVSINLVVVSNMKQRKADSSTDHTLLILFLSNEKESRVLEQFQ